MFDSGQKLKYSVDIIKVIDATGSMAGLIGKVKTNALAFHERLTAALEEQGKEIDPLRVKVIAYRDYAFDGPRAMNESPFFTLPDEKEQFAEFVRKLEANGGGDEPEHGLEALALAMKSKWATSGDKRREVVVVWTDASAHPLEKTVATPPAHYPGDLPKDFDALTDLWEGQEAVMNTSTKRLILFAPDCEPWNTIANCWNNVIQHPARAGEGLAETDYKTVLNTIANSI
jgi:hypothetical protein